MCLRQFGRSASTTRFNRYIVECKLVLLSCYLVLSQDLIDTQWNVNQVGLNTTSQAFRFNRYIVECKFTYTSVSSVLVLDLIDTQWNVNPLASGVVGACSRFNRYIVECKYSCIMFYRHYLSRFNRYIVECKYITSPHSKTSYVDLIDTQWNVNTFSPDGERHMVLLDLIDTQWNVNYVIPDPKHPEWRFNRYIVECKCLCSTRYLRQSRDLIDTQWNVNTVAK